MKRLFKDFVKDFGVVFAAMGAGMVLVLCCFMLTALLGWLGILLSIAISLATWTIINIIDNI